ncbi:DMT family transporter [Aquibium carbonis]|nr:DMT family transporter [Aquibium carbonis]
MTSHSGRQTAAIVVMVLTPLFFSTNLIFGRGVIGEVAPFTLAFLRWGAVALALSPCVLADRAAARRLVLQNGPFLMLLGFLGMWFCGALVYIALQRTTATNGTLIYTTSPVFIILIDAVVNRRRIGLRPAAGSVLALTGIAFIVLRGELSALLSLDFNEGDLLFVGAAIAWAVYSLMLRSPRVTGVANLALLPLIAAAGALLLAPFAAWEFFAGAPMPVTASAWSGIAGIVVFASLAAFLGFQFGVRRLGAPVAGVFMYLMPPFGVGLAVLFLGESFHTHHALGIVLVTGGVILATLPATWLPRRR